MPSISFSCAVRLSICAAVAAFGCAWAPARAGASPTHATPRIARQTRAVLGRDEGDFEYVMVAVSLLVAEAAHRRLHSCPHAVDRLGQLPDLVHPPSPHPP